MKRAIVRSLVLGLLLAMMMTITGCDKDTPTALSGDRQIRLQIVSIGTGWPDTTWWGPGAWRSLQKFDKRNYPGVDSAIWIGYFYPASGGGRAHIQLYNYTDSLAIAGSELISDSLGTIPVQSGNIFKALPDHEVTLGFRMRSDSVGTYVLCDMVELYLFRR